MTKLKSVNSARLSLFCQNKCGGRLTTFHPPELRWRSIPAYDLSIYQGGLIWSWWHCLEVSGRCDCIWLGMGGEWFQVQAKMDNATLYQQWRKPAWSSFHANAWNVQGGTVNVTERTLFALPCADDATRVMSSDLLNWITGSPCLTLLYSGQNLQRKACSV